MGAKVIGITIIPKTFWEKPLKKSMQLRLALTHVR